MAHPSVGSATARPAQLPSRPGPEDIAKGLRAEDDVDEIVKLCADLVAAGFIEPTTWRRGRRSGHGSCLTVARKGREKTRAGYRTKPHGLDDGREGLQRALSVLHNSVVARLAVERLRAKAVGAADDAQQTVPSPPMTSFSASGRPPPGSGPTVGWCRRSRRREHSASSACPAEPCSRRASSPSSPS